MKISEARKLAETAKPEDIRQMFINAQNSITDWTKPARVNKSMTKGTAFNILSKCMDTSNKIAIRNMIWEFGEYLPGYTKPEAIKSTVKLVHQEPIKINP